MLVGIEDLRLRATLRTIAKAPRQNSVSRLLERFLLSTCLEFWSMIAISSRGRLSWDSGDVSRPNLIQGCDLLEINQAGESLGWLVMKRGARLLVSRT